MNMRAVFWGALLLAPSAALGAGLTAADYRYLETEFALRADGQLLRDATLAEQANLASLINDPVWQAQPAATKANVADYLFAIHMQQCQAWWLAHPAEECPPAADPAARLGQAIADARCNACHLFGTPTAPAFFRLAVQGGWTAARLDSALKQGHFMSPISLKPEQVNQLVVYINSLH